MVDFNGLNPDLTPIYRIAIPAYSLGRIAMQAGTPLAIYAPVGRRPV